MWRNIQFVLLRSCEMVFKKAYSKKLIYFKLSKLKLNKITKLDIIYEL